VAANGKVYHSLHHFSWFSPSNGDPFIATYVSHTTVNPDGSIEVDFDYLNGGCMESGLAPVVSSPAREHPGSLANGGRS
jgi:hypothetical protein